MDRHYNKGWTHDSHSADRTGTPASSSLPLHRCAETAPRPNIIIILVDDMGFSDIGCYGSEIQTPNLDMVAAKGLRFTQFYNTGRCCPTRAIAADRPVCRTKPALGT